jgi:hypothetical protein
VTITGWLLERGTPYVVAASFQLFLSILALVGLLAAVYTGGDTWSGLLSLLGFALPLVGFVVPKAGPLRPRDP